MPRIIDRNGQAREFVPTLEHYRAAADGGMTLPQYLSSIVDTDEEKYGTPFEQLLASCGLYVRADRIHGLRPPTMDKVLNGGVQIDMNAITRPDGSKADTLSGRMLFPAVILELIENELREDHSGYAAIWNRMIALTTSVNSARFDQPIIDYSRPREARSQPIAQMAEPSVMLSITLAEKSYRVPTFSIGIEISDEAARYSTLDLVGIAVREQAEAERIARIDEDIKKMVNGDADLGITPLSSSTFQSLDSEITGAGSLTQRAWLKWLRSDYKRKTIDWVITDIDTYLAVEKRTDRPTVFGNVGTDERLNTTPLVANPGLPDNVWFFLVEPEILGANTLVGLDSRRAIRKVVYVDATYQAIEQFVMRRSTAMRFDFAEMSMRLFDQAWSKMTLTV